MNVYPIIMCGGSGTRLWPISRPARPKQFASFVGASTLFRQTVARLRGLEDFAALVIVGGVSQSNWIGQQIDTPEGARDHVLLEPVARDSAPAVIAAVRHVHDLDPQGIVVMAASDHHIPDASAFQAVIATAVAEAANRRIVTLGIHPRHPSSAYGYILPEDGSAPVSPVARFVEKPDEATARTYIDTGYVWNSGIFIARADTFLEQCAIHAPDVERDASLAMREARRTSEGLVLADSFADVRKVSIDYAVMEHTDRASVVAAKIEWSDLGAWDAVHALSSRDADNNVFVGPVHAGDVRNSLIFNSTDRLTVVQGMDGINVVVDDDVVLISPLADAQGVKEIVGGLKDAGRAETDMQVRPFDLAGRTVALERWLAHSALPLWWTYGYDHGARMWREELGPDARPTGSPARGRVQARQTFAFALARRNSHGGPWDAVIAAGEAGIDAYRDSDGLVQTLVAPDGTVLDERRYLYDQTFELLAIATAHGVAEEARALRLLDAIEATFAREGEGYRETGDDPFQSNAHMHLFEAALGWVEAGGGERWLDLAARLSTLAQRHFISDGGFVREFFVEGWQAAPGARGRIVEPGHQFEWSWLMHRWSDLGGSPEDRVVSERLFEAGMYGVDPRRGVAVDTMDDTLQRTTTGARLWVQTEWLKAALVRLERAPDADRTARQIEVRRALGAVESYLLQPADGVVGLWRDRNRADGTFEEGPSPASSLYHIATAIAQLRRTVDALE